MEVYSGNLSKAIDEEKDNRGDYQGDIVHKGEYNVVNLLEKRLERLEKTHEVLLQQNDVGVPIKVPENGWRAQIIKPEYLCPAFLGFAFNALLLAAIIGQNKIPGLSICPS